MGVALEAMDSGVVVITEAFEIVLLLRSVDRVADDFRGRSSPSIPGILGASGC